MERTSDATPSSTASALLRAQPRPEDGRRAAVPRVEEQPRTPRG
jgi:hypothetical protein